MEMVSSKEGEATDTTARLISEQVSQDLHKFLHEELQSLLKQLQATLSSHSNGHSSSLQNEELRKAGSSLMPVTRPIASMTMTQSLPVFSRGSRMDRPSSVPKQATRSSAPQHLNPQLEKISSTPLSVWDDDELTAHHRRGYLAQREIENVKSEEEQERLLKGAKVVDSSDQASRMAKAPKTGAREKQKVNANGHGTDSTATRSANSAGEKSSSIAMTKTGTMGTMSRESQVFYHTGKSNKRGKTGKLSVAQMSLFRIRVARMVNALWFDSLLGLSIVTNAILIGIQTDWNVKHRGEEVPHVFRVFDLVFCTIFVAELALRLFVWRLKFYVIRGWGWNMFDTAVVFAQVFEEAMMLLSDSVLSNLSFMRIMRIFRLIRIIRLVRILRIIGELRLLVLSIMHSLKSLMWTVVLILLLLYMNAVWVTQVVADETDRVASSKIFYYYGSLITSCVSLFQSITGGIDWDDAMRPLAEEISPVWGLVYCLYIAFSVFAMLNVVTGVFVESALASAHEDKDIITVCTMSDFFKKATADGGNEGQMSWEDFENNLHTPHMKDYFKLIDMDVSEARAIFKLLDLTQSGWISLDEFLSGCVRLRGSAKAIDLAMLMHEVRRIETMLKAARDESNAQFALAGVGVSGEQSKEIFEEKYQSHAFQEKHPVSTMRKVPLRGSIEEGEDDDEVLT